jgi:hypothetical protein
VNIREWIRLYSIEPPESEVYSFRGWFKFVLCGSCGKIMHGPFWGNGWWLPDELVIRKWHKCEHCGTRNRVVNRVRRRVQHAEEFEEDE